jgi:hypothetical protein
VIRETNRALVPGVNQIAALEQRQVGMNRGGRRNRHRLAADWQREAAQRQNYSAAANEFLKLNSIFHWRISPFSW